MTTFHNITSITEKYRSSILEDNLKSFLDWSFLHIGGFINVNIPTNAITGTIGFHSLQKSNDNTIKGNRLWESPRKDWVYESGISYSGSSPNRFSGVYLNGSFLPSPTGSGNYTYSVNYPLGQILFDNSVSSSSRVSASYSYRNVQVYKASEASWWKEIQKETYNPAKYQQNGDTSIFGQHRVQTPCIILELSPRIELKPHSLGNVNNIWIQEIFLHIFSHTSSQRNILLDILLAQKDKVIWLYNSNSVAQSNRYFLDQHGNINPSGYNYPQLVDEFRYKWCTINNSTIGETNTLSDNLFNGIVRWSIEIFP